LVGVLELPVVLAVFLDRVVGQVDEVVVDVARREGLRRRADVPLLEEEDVHLFGQQGPDADVEFAVVDQKGFLYVFLDDEGAGVEFELLGRLEFGLCAGFQFCCLFEVFLQRGVLFLSFLCVFICLLVSFLGACLLELLPVHEFQVVEQYLFELFEGVEDLYASAAVESGGFEEPQVAVF
jgi:hypothetical protein